MTSIVHCNDCGQKNRVPVIDSTLMPQGKKLICGSCKQPLAFDASDLDLDGEGEAFDIEGGQE